MDTAMEKIILDYLNYQLLAIDYVAVTAITLLLYDYALTIHLEVKLMWFSSWNHLNVLFLLVRYAPLMNICLMVHDQLIVDASVNSCHTTQIVSNVLYIIGFTSAEAIILTRTWALWYRDRKVGIFFLALWVACTILAIIFNKQFLDSVHFGPPPYSGFRGCFMTQKPRGLSSAFLTIAVIDAIVLAGASISAFRAYRSGSNGEFVFLIHKDAILFNTYLLMCSTTSVILAFVVSDKREAILTPVLSAFHSIFASRILFNLRSAGRTNHPNVTTEFHSHRHGMSMPLEFVVQRDSECEELDLWPEDLALP